MKVFEFILIFTLVIFLCSLTAFNRWNITIQGDWDSKPGKASEITETEPPAEEEILANLPVSRMEFLIFLSRELDLKPEDGPVSFKDIQQSSTNFRYIYPMLKSGYISGYPDNTFRPNEFITENEADIIIARVLHHPGPPYDKESPLLTKKKMFDLLSQIKYRYNNKFQVSAMRGSLYCLKS